jgi:hypothetical protein
MLTLDHNKELDQESSRRIERLRNEAVHSRRMRRDEFRQYRHIRRVSSNEILALRSVARRITSWFR